MKHNKNIDELVTKILKESLEDKVVEITKNIKRKLQENKCPDCGEEICECGETMEEMTEEDTSTACETYKYHLKNFGEDDERTQQFKVKCGETSEIDEELHGKQHKLDVAKPKGKLTKADFDKLRGETEESETEEGNAFTGALSDARKNHKKEFEVDGKTYQVKEEKNEKFIQKAVKKMDKKGTEGSFKKYCGGEVTKDCIEKGLKSKDPKIVKKANFAKNIKAYKGATHESKKSILSVTESELVDLIESIVNEQKSLTNNSKGESKNQKTNIKIQKPKGLSVYEKVHGKDKNENDEYLKSVVAKFKDYLKDGSKGSYDMNPNHFPKGNGELAKMNKKAYVPSEAVDEYVDAFAYPGQTNLRYDEIKPNNDRIRKHLEGDSTTGNSQEYANAVKSDVGKKFKKNFDENLYGAEQADASYKRQPAPVDIEGETTEKGSLKSKKTSAKKAKEILNKLESVEDKKDKKLTEEFQKITKLMKYNNKTQ